MLVRLEPSSSKPIYLQIADSIAGHIESGSLKAGDRLPSARSLGATLNVNMHTVLKAYAALDSRNVVEMRRGRGGVVVASRSDLQDMADAFVRAAKRQRLGKAEVAKLVEEAWR
jgi:GntR family transcriptional regulator